MCGEDILNSNISCEEKERWARSWLGLFRAGNLLMLRDRVSTFGVRKNCRTTLVLYYFSDDDSKFEEFEFSILHTWMILGKMPCVLIVNKFSSAVKSFARSFADTVEVQVENRLIPGRVETMSRDCVTCLWKRIKTENMLVIQNDGFPLRDRLNDFQGCGYVGAPVTFKAMVLGYWPWAFVQNGGFSLRSRSFSRMVSCVCSEKHLSRAEDWVYSYAPLRHPCRFRAVERKASRSLAREFSAIDFRGLIDISNAGYKPFGVHGATAIYQRRKDLAALGYDVCTKIG